MTGRSFTRTELAGFDGKEGRPAYVVYRGRVYDASHSFLWMGGRHQALHEAGRDLTEDLGRAPHGEDLLERLLLVGVLADGDS
jgi:predicted heme/steroid binding protein